MEEIKEETSLQNMSVYPVDSGIAIEIFDGSNKSVVVLGPDEAGRLASSLLTTTVLFQVNFAMLKAAEAREFERIRSEIEKGSLDLSKVKK